MKVIIAGSRTIRLSVRDIHQIVLDSKFDVTSIVNGGCRSGIDFDAITWAHHKLRYVERFHADWNKHGRAAGPIRNKQMAEYADALILIWDGKSKGSASMKEEAKKAEIPVYEVIIMREKYSIGTKWLFTNTETKETFECEVISHNDSRLAHKFSWEGDLCLYFPELNWANTYDLENAEEYLENINA